MPAGIGISLVTSVRTSSAKPPQPMNAITRSPTFTESMPSPTSLTMPATSPPGAKGIGGLNWYLPWMMRVSGKFTPQAFTPTTTCPIPGLSVSTSSSTRLSGGPYSLHNTAFMILCPWPSMRSDECQNAFPGVRRLIGVLGLHAVKETVRGTRIGYQFMFDTGMGESNIELLYTLCRNVRIRAAKETQYRATKILHALYRGRRPVTCWPAGRSVKADYPGQPMVIGSLQERGGPAKAKTNGEDRL